MKCFEVDLRGDCMGLYRNMHGERTRQWKPVLSSKGAMVKKTIVANSGRGATPAFAYFCSFAACSSKASFIFAGCSRKVQNRHLEQLGTRRLLKKSQGREVWVKGFRVRTSDTPESPQNTSFFFLLNYRKATVSIGVAFFWFWFGFFFGFCLALFWLLFGLILAFF